MSLPRVASRQEWLNARTELLADEKAMTRARDEMNTKRRELPMVKVDKEYVFEGPESKASLLDLFEGPSHLLRHDRRPGRQETQGLGSLWRIFSWLAFG